ncbi:MAG: hypothetical protein LBS64_06285 [Spirochaetaceae bacterium]|jgi:hypothetical protein|nr:hypothetical protein [Spirochaetaceae bacterium]
MPLILEIPSPSILVGEDVVYTLFIPGVRPSDVDTALPAMPQGFSVRAMTKDAAFAGDQSGTRITVTIAADAPSAVALPPMGLRIGDGPLMPVPFQAAVVREDPRAVMPELVFRNEAPDAGATPVTARVGEPLDVTLYGRYAVSYRDLSWSLPEDAAFSLVERLALLDDGPPLAARDGFIRRLQPLARFRWTPLESGVLTLPVVRLRAGTLAGNQAVVTVEEVQVRVAEAREAAPAGGAEPGDTLAMWAQAFEVPPDGTSSSVSDSASSMVSGAVGDFFWLPPLLIAGLLAGIAGLAIRRFFLRRGGSRRTAATLLALAVISGALCLTVAASRRGVFAGGEIKAVPDPLSSAVITLEAGTPVRIVKRSQTWYYVETGSARGNARGWVPAESVTVP